MSVKGGSYRFIFQNKTLKTKKIIKNSIIKEKRITGSTIKKFKELQRLNQINSTKFNKFLDKKIKDKKIIAGFGASVGTTTLIYDFAVTNKIKYLFDNEKRRFNLFCPGTKIKVINPKKIKKYNIDYMVIFAWRYTKVILERNKKLFNKETRFVVPHPQFRILKM